MLTKMIDARIVPQKMIDFLVRGLALLFCMLPLHEFGHYLAGKRLGLKDMRLTLLKYRRVPYGVAVIGVFGDVSDVKDFAKFHAQANCFLLMGSLFTVIGIMLFTAIGIFNIYVANSLILLSVCYMIWEVVNPKNITTSKDE